MSETVFEAHTSGSEGLMDFYRPNKHAEAEEIKPSANDLLLFLLSKIPALRLPQAVPWG